MLINAKQVKNLIKAADMQTSSDAIEAFNKFVDEKLNKVIANAKQHGVKRLHIEDFQLVLQNDHTA